VAYSLNYLLIEGTGLMLAGLIQGVTGFGIGLVAVGILLIYHPPAVVIPSLVGVYIFTSVVLLYENRVSLNRKIMGGSLLLSFPSLVLALLGMIGGSFLLKTISSESLTLMIGIFISLFSLYSFFRARLNDKLALAGGLANRNETKERILCYSASSIGGLLEGLLGLGGPPIVIYLVYKRLDSKIFIATLSAFFLWVNPLRLIHYVILGFIDFEVVKLLLFIFIFVAVGLLSGIFIRKRLMTESKFRMVVVTLLLAIGMSLIFRSLQ
jgi:uncharacterized membrane protein YfcA